MNNVNLDDYIEKDWKLPEPVIPSQELVEKWKQFLDYGCLKYQYYYYVDDWYAMIHAYMHQHMWDGDPVLVTPVEEKDRMDVASKLEYLAKTIDENLPLTGYENFHNEQQLQARNNHQRRKWIMLTYRAKLTESKI